MSQRFEDSYYYINNQDSQDAQFDCLKCGPGCRCGPGCKCGEGCDCTKSQSNTQQNRGQIAPLNRTSNPNQNQSQPQSCQNLSTKQLDQLCQQTVNEFKKFDPKAAIFPGIGLPSQNNGVCSIIHGMPPGTPNLKINGLESKSPLANAALYSSECAGGKFLNLYEMMLPDPPSKTPGDLSNAELYAKELNQQGLSVAGSHWHWWGTTPFVAAIHHQNVGMVPTNFVRRTVQSLNRYHDRSMSGNYLDSQ